MKVTIVGWYGTETIGDRAILAGIFKLLSNSFGKINVYLGSLYPFFTKRTVKEDASFWQETMKTDVHIKLFDSKNANELVHAISQSDLVIMGGGPLMHITPMYMIRYAFKVAKKLGKKTMLFGCGVGPIFTQSFQSCLLDIVDHSDSVVLRDSASLKTLASIAENLNRQLKKNVSISLDPSVLTCDIYRKTSTKKALAGNYIAINLRQFPRLYSQDKLTDQISTNLITFVDALASSDQKSLLKLIPMHYFHLGGDDRAFLTFVSKSNTNKNIQVQNTPLTLEETLAEFANARKCYGMRLHSVILQTMVNGNNYVLDYTEPKRGKVLGFIKEIDTHNFYTNRYINLQTDQTYTKLLANNTHKFTYSPKQLTERLGVYTHELTTIFS